MSTTTKDAQRDTARDRQRYRYIKMVVDTANTSLKQLHAEHSKKRRASGANPVTYPFFTRVLKGEKRSHEIMRWTARRLNIPYKELWA
jgi:hypothetical protein